MAYLFAARPSNPAHLDRRIVSADLRAGLAESACFNASGQLAGKPAMAVAVDLEAEGDQVGTRRWIRPKSASMK
jgi:hypothetical protein